jgi:DegV family protein with EDD domain
VPRTRIVTDGDAVITPKTAQRLGISVVPLTVRVGGEVYQDGNGGWNEALLARMEAERISVEIAGPTVADFRAVYNRLSRITDRIISIHSSDHLSPIVRNARAAAAEFLGRCDIAVIDSQTTSLGLSILVEQAAKMAQAGVSQEGILRTVRGMIRRIYVVMFTDSLDYLERSGLISPAQCILGTMLGIKPFLSIEEGEIIPMEKVRSRDKGLDKLVEFAGEFTAVDQIAILQPTSRPTSETALLRDRLRSFFPDKEFPVLVYGPLLASHIGPDSLGLIIYEGLEPVESP